VVVKLTRSLWTAAWRLLQSENQEAARVQRIQQEAEALRRRNAERLTASHLAAEQELEACLHAPDLEPGRASSETTARRAEEPCQENRADRL
jgi:hypothetical protein